MENLGSKLNEERKMQETSLEAFESIQHNLGDRQLAVYRAIKELGEATNTMISKYLELPINCITPRCKELRDQFKCVGVSKIDRCPITGRKAIFWRIVR